jgi:hypothetical protein
MALWADLMFVIASRFLVLLEDEIKSLLFISKTDLKKLCFGHSVCFIFLYNS